MSKQVFIVNADYQNYRLDKLMRKLQPQWTKVYVQKLIANKDIRVNGQRTRSSYHLQINDQISFFGLTNPELVNKSNFATHQLTKLAPLDVVFEDENVIVVVKPVGITVQADGHHHYDNMNNRLINHLKFTNNTDFKPIFVHRLDTNTSGLLIGAKTYQAYQALFQALKNNKITKIYDVLVWNQFRQQRMEIKHFLLKNHKQNKVLVFEYQIAGSKYAHSSIKLIKNFNYQSHLKVKIHTGRTHQIRAQLSFLNHGVCGDKKYFIHPNNQLFPTQALIASELWFNSSICHGPLIGLLNQRFRIDKIWFLNKKYLILPGPRFSSTK